MTKEEEKAIEIVAKYLNFNEICGTRNFKEALETVLNMLKEKDKLYHKALGDLVKADRENIQLKKQIDLMGEYISKYDTDEGICEEQAPLGCNEINREVDCKECIKQYFEKKVEEER